MIDLVAASGEGSGDDDGDGGLRREIGCEFGLRSAARPRCGVNVRQCEAVRGKKKGDRALLGLQGRMGGDG